MAMFFVVGIQMLASLYQCLNLHGDYVK